jgi:hypothetical protein
MTVRQPRRWFAATLALASSAACKSPGRDGEPHVKTDSTTTKQEVRTERAACEHVVAGELRGRARIAVGLSVQLSLALPIAWPTSSEGVMVLAYPSETLPTGMHRTRLRSPSHRIVFAPINADPRIEPLGESTVLGTQDDTAEPVDPALVERAEQAIVDIVAGCRTAEQATNDIRPYLRWLDEEPVIAQDLVRRNRNFIAWLRTVL